MDATAGHRPDATSGHRPEPGDGELTERQRGVLDFERTWWQYDACRDDQIRARFGCSPDEYDAELDEVLDLPGAMRHDPLVVRRFQRRRLRRRRALIEGHTKGVQQ